MAEGWIKLHRHIKDHWLWKSDNRLKWWIDILLTVNHSESKVLIKGTLIECKRGQSIRSLESWAKDWNVSKGAVRDFFKLLQSDEMIVIESLVFTTRITVCKYEDYQTEVNAKETQKKRKGNAKETLALPKQEYKEEEEYKEVFIYSKFYDFELKNSNNDSKYFFFIKFIYGQNETNEKLSGLLSIPKQLTFDQFNKLLEKAKTNGMKLMDIVTKIENDKKYWKGKKSLYLTMNNWIENRFAK